MTYSHNDACSSCRRNLDPKERGYYVLNKQTFVFELVCAKCNEKMITEPIKGSEDITKQTSLRSPKDRPIEVLV